MKTKQTSLTITILLITLFTLFVSKSNAQTLIDTTTATGISNTLNSAPATNAPAIRDRIRADLDSKIQNARNNQEVRNQMIEGGYRITSTTTPRPPLQKPINYQKISTTSPQINQKIRVEKIETLRENREVQKTMAIEMLKEKRDNLGKNLEVALKNLVELRKRVVSRMEKDRNEGKDLTKVKELLVIADSKISLAKQAVEAVKSYKPENSVQVSTSTTNCVAINNTSDSNNSSSTQRCLPYEKNVNLDTIRALVYKAQQAIKDAHKALTEVVVAIAKISGNRQLPPPPSTSPTVTPSNSPSVSTTTATNQ